MNKRKGFTLVELLAVIVILAIIMIIAIPAVLDTMQKAQKKTFAEYATKVYTSGQTKYFADTSLGNVPAKVNGTNCTIYDIQDIGMDSTGNYKGNIAFCSVSTEGGGTETQILVRLFDGTYSLKGTVNNSQWYNFTSTKKDPNVETDVITTQPNGTSSTTKPTDTDFPKAGLPGVVAGS